MITKYLGFIVFLDGITNIVWFNFHDKKQKHHKKYQFGRVVRTLIGLWLVLI